MEKVTFLLLHVDVHLRILHLAMSLPSRGQTRCLRLIYCMYPTLLLIILEENHSNYHRFRQYPNYSKTKPPPALADHFTPEVFAKSQDYGRDKAKFSLVSGIYTQLLETAILYFGGYAWAWGVAGSILSYFGYGPEYEVSEFLTSPLIEIVIFTFIRSPKVFCGVLCYSPCHPFPRFLWRFIVHSFLRRNTASTKPPP